MTFARQLAQLDRMIATVEETRDADAVPWHSALDLLRECRASVGCAARLASIESPKE